MNIENLKQELLEDLRLCIATESTVEQDIITLMECYLKLRSMRPKLIVEIRNLLVGKEYVKPQTLFSPYQESDVDKLDQILTYYIKNCNCSNAEVLTSETIELINNLHYRCKEELIDEWRDERLRKIFISVTENCGYEKVDVLITSLARW